MNNKIIFTILTTFFLAFTATTNAFGQKGKSSKESSPIVTLSAENYSAETAKGLVFVDYWAAWCGPCRRIAPILEDIAQEYKGTVKIGKLNVDNYKKFSLDNGIEALPTIVVYKDGKELTRILGLVSKDELVKVIKTYSAETAMAE